MFLTNRALVLDVKVNSVSGVVMLDGKVAFEGVKEGAVVWPATKAMKNRRVDKHLAMLPPVSGENMIEMIEMMNCK